MKRLQALALTVLTVFTLTACGAPSEREVSPPPGRFAGSFWGWIEDLDGGEIIHDISITVDGFALDTAGQEDSIWGANWTATGLPGPLPLDLVKRSPFHQPVYWEPGQTISLAVTIIFEDAQFGDKVQCWQDDSTGAINHDSERVTIREQPGRGPISVNCTFLFR